MPMWLQGEADFQVSGGNPGKDTIHAMNVLRCNRRHRRRSGLYPSIPTAGNGRDSIKGPYEVQ